LSGSLAGQALLTHDDGASRPVTTSCRPTPAYAYDLFSPVLIPHGGAALLRTPVPVYAF